MLMGFEFSNTADALVTRILSKSMGLIRQINGIDQPPLKDYASNHPFPVSLPRQKHGWGYLNSTALTMKGIPGDRCWTVKDEERGGIEGGKRFPQLMDMHAALEHEPDARTPSPPVVS